jgi:hypothetical protein
MWYNIKKGVDMYDVKNVVDFADLCMFAESEKIAFYNEAHDLLYKEAYPSPESNFREVYLSEMKYLEDGKVKEILEKFMKKEKVTYITVAK